MNKHIKNFENSGELENESMIFLKKIRSINSLENISHARYSKEEFEEFVRIALKENVVEYVMGYWRIRGQNLKMSKEQTRKLCIEAFASFDAKKDKNGYFIVAGELCEFLAFLHMKYILGIPPLVNKVYEGDSGHQIKGFDGIHIDDQLHLSLIESKIYADLQTGIKDASESIDDIWTSSKKIRKEKTLIQTQIKTKKSLANYLTKKEFTKVGKKHKLNYHHLKFEEQKVNINVYIILKETEYTEKEIEEAIEKKWASTHFLFSEVNFFIFETKDVNKLRGAFYEMVNGEKNE